MRYSKDVCGHGCIGALHNSVPKDTYLNVTKGVVDPLIAGDQWTALLDHIWID